MPSPLRRAPPGIDEAAQAALFEGIPSSALWSLLLDVFSARAARSIPLIDGGAFDWVAKLASNRRLVFVASGMGAQLLPLLFRALTPPREI
jgi:hypothetical protein